MAGFDWKFRTSVHFLPYFKTYLRKDIPYETQCIKIVVQGVVFSLKTTVQYGHMLLNEKVCWWGCDLLEKKVIDLLSDEGSESQKLSVYPMQHSLEKIALSWVFTVEQLQKLKHELLINHFFANTWLEVWRLEKSEEKLVHKLKVESKHTYLVRYHFKIHGCMQQSVTLLSNLWWMLISKSKDFVRSDLHQNSTTAWVSFELASLYKGYPLGQATIFGATCLTQNSNQSGQLQFWKQFHKDSLKTPKYKAIWSWWISEGPPE